MKWREVNFYDSLTSRDTCKINWPLVSFVNQKGKDNAN